MPSAGQIHVLKDAEGVSAYRFAVGVGGGLSVVRDFKSEEESQRFAGTDRKPKGQKRA